MRSANPKPSQEELIRQIEFFNRMCPVGTAVTVRSSENNQEIVTTRVRACAALVGGDHPQVFLEGFPNGVHIDRVSKLLGGAA